MEEKKTVTESIYSDGDVVVAMALVQHIEKRFKSVYKAENGITKQTDETEPNGIMVITSHTKWNLESDDWENPIYIGQEKASDFIHAWCSYRSEVEGNIIDPNEFS